LELDGLRGRKQCSFAQLMIAWTLAHGAVDVALCGARVAAQARENAGAGRVSLDATDLLAIAAAAARHLGELD
ncbi:MAG: aldo/keto reductase, partial [Hylemonella sp.]